MKKYIFLIFFLLPQVSLAGVIVEPFAGLQKGDWDQIKQTYDYGIKMRGDIYGYIMGAKLVYKLNYVFFLIDYYRSKTEWTYNVVTYSESDDQWRQSLISEEDVVSLAMGVWLFKKKFSLWVGYNIYDRAELGGNFAPNEDGITYKGNGYRLGISYRPFRRISFRLNFEYATGKYTKMNQGGVSKELPGTLNNIAYNKNEYNKYLVYISFPLYFIKSRYSWVQEDVERVDSY